MKGALFMSKADPEYLESCRLNLGGGGTPSFGKGKFSAAGDTASDDGREPKSWEQSFRACPRYWPSYDTAGTYPGVYCMNY